MDDILKDPLIGGDGHLDGIKVHTHEDSISIKLGSSFWNKIKCINEEETAV